MSKWLSLAWVLDYFSVSSWLSSMFNRLPCLQNRVHAQMTEVEYRQWHPDLVNNKGISC
ncbi:hypothetical protein HZU75_03190 [Chitinibacter fontanus]|uniref:Uncharacterized protein n=1 Tax=Chitinibacter fontanus TaxID=1737446 RepID=A0A7D5V8G4_9NEIS|nr:hypothetical protein [Chitinibacter fontanus]QLI80614.1 hypothetical protein HZU75_03190 [Chitinibacter fontanus]